MTGEDSASTAFEWNLLIPSIAQEGVDGDLDIPGTATPNLAQGAARGMRSIMMVDLARGAEIGRWTPDDDSRPPFVWSAGGRFLLCPTRDCRIPPARKVLDQAAVLERMQLDLTVPDRAILLDREGRVVWQTLLPDGATVASLERLQDGTTVDDTIVTMDGNDVILLAVQTLGQQYTAGE